MYGVEVGESVPGGVVGCRIPIERDLFIRAQNDVHTEYHEESDY
jgi:hypothetical protein